MTPEGKVKAWAVRQYDVVFPGHWRIAPRGGPFGRAGAGDHILCWRGVFIMIEIKSDHGELTDLQTIQLHRVRDAFGVAAVLRGKDLHKLYRIRDAALQQYAMIAELACALRELDTVGRYSSVIARAKEHIFRRCADDIPIL